MIIFSDMPDTAPHVHWDNPIEFLMTCIGIEKK
jgi:hypothetical protein